MRFAKGVQPMLHTILRIVLGLVVIGVLSLFLETTVLKKYHGVRILLAVIITVAAYRYWGYHSWWIVVGLAFALIQAVREIQSLFEKKST